MIGAQLTNNFTKLLRFISRARFSLIQSAKLYKDLVVRLLHGALIVSP